MKAPSTLAGETALVPVLPGATIEEIVAQVRGAASDHVELLAPNRTRALQSLAGCELLKQATVDAGLRVTLFSADEQIISSATVAGLDVIAVGSAIVPQPRATVGSATPAAQSSAPPGPRKFSPRSAAAPGTAAAAPAGVGASDDNDFLARLSAFDRQQAPVPQESGTVAPTPEGATLFDVAGDRGVRRPDAARRDAWDAAFDDMGQTMAAEPEPRRVVRTRGADETTRQPAVATPRRGLAAFLPALPRRQPAAQTAGVGAAPRQTQVAPKGALRPQRSLLWPLALGSAIAILALAWYGISGLGVGPGRPEIVLSPAAPATEAQTFTGLEIPIGPAAGGGAIEGQVLEQPVSVVIQGEAISTTLVPIGRATGTLILRNRNAFPATLTTGQLVQAANGVSFSVDTGVTVPAAMERPDGSGTTYGQGSVNLTATVPGAIGNIPAGSISAIPGVEVALRLEHVAFNGGSDQEATIVRTEDVNRVLPLAVSRLWAAANQGLAASVATQSDLVLATDSITPTLADLGRLQGLTYAVFPGIGNVTSDGTFRFELRGTFRGVAQPVGRPLPEQLRELVRRQLLATGQTTEDTEVQIQNWTVRDNQLIVDATTQPSGVTAPLAPDFLAQVQEQIRGTSRETARLYLESLVVDRKIASFSELPAEWETVPEKVVILPHTAAQ